MWLGGRAGVIVAALACALALATTAAAAEPAPGEGEAAAGFTVRGTHGYSVLVFAAPEAGEPGKGEALILVSHKGGGVIYQASATLTSGVVEGLPAITSLQVNLGALGRLAVDLKPSGMKKVVRPSCAAEPLTLPAGTYEGTIEFHGEQNFTDVDATRVVARPEAFVELLCKAVGECIYT